MLVNVAVQELSSIVLELSYSAPVLLNEVGSRYGVWSTEYCGVPIGNRGLIRLIETSLMEAVGGVKYNETG
jgi:hypothetical protein